MNPARPNPSPAYRADIDGLRGVAVLAVVAFHAFPSRLPGGFVGVDVFFVISGFLISNIVLKGLEQRTFSFRDFYVRRVARIFPALFVVLASAIAFGWLVMLSVNFRRLGLHTAASGAFVANVVFWRESGYFDSAAELKPLLHLWSLGVEEQFYLVWPALLYFAARHRLAPLKVIGVISVGSFALNVAAMPTRASDAFFLAHARMWELLLGAYLAHASLEQRASSDHSELKSVLGLALIAASFVTVDASAFPGWWALLPTIGAGLVISAGPDTTINRWLLARRAMVFVGLISYPLYLWHWPVLAFARQLSPDALSAPRTLALLGVSVALASVTYLVVERPIRYGRFAGARWRTPTLASAMVIVTIGGGVVARDALPSRLGSRYPVLSRNAYDFQRAYRGSVCQLSNKQTASDFQATCIDSTFGEPGLTSILIWGDSHAAHLYPGLQSLAQSHHVALAQFTADACAPVLDERTDFCQGITRYVLDRVRSLKPDIVVLASRWLEHPPAQVIRTVATLYALGVKQIVVVGPVPQWKRPLPNMLSGFMQTHPLSAIPDRLSIGLEPQPSTIDTLLRTALANTRVRYVSATDALCRPDGCLTLSDGQLTAWDQTHLTDAGSRVLARAILRIAPPDSSR